MPARATAVTPAADSASGLRPVSVRSRSATADALSPLTTIASAVSSVSAFGGRFMETGYRRPATGDRRQKGQATDVGAGAAETRVSVPGVSLDVSTDRSVCATQKH